MSRKTLPAAFEVEVPLDPRTPIVLEEHARVLAFAVVGRASLQGLTADWDSPGVYVLLGRIGQGVRDGKAIGPDEWVAYVGQATNLRSRLREHSRGKDFWATAVLVRRYGGRALNRAHIAWLEHALHERLMELPGVYLENSNTPPTDQGLSLSDERMAEEIAESTLQALSLIGYRAAGEPQARQATSDKGGRDYWVSRAGSENVELGDRILSDAAAALGLASEFGYKSPYVALLAGAQCDLRMLIRPQRVGVLCEYKISKNDEISSMLERSGIETLPYIEKWKQYRVRVTNENFAEHRDLLIRLATIAWATHPSTHSGSPSVATKKSESRNKSGKQQPAIKILRESGSIPDGTKFYLKPGTLSAKTRKAVEAWAAEDPGRETAVWHNTTTPLRWNADGQDYTPTTLSALILKAATGATTAINGAQWWVTADGEDIATLAKRVDGS